MEISNPKVGSGGNRWETAGGRRGWYFFSRAPPQHKPKNWQIPKRDPQALPGPIDTPEKGAQPVLEVIHIGG